MNIIRHLDFFNPIDIKQEIHIIGVGAVGSHIANNLARLGVKEITIWDIDTVDEKNIPNQMFLEHQIGMKKTEATKMYLEAINKDIKINIKEGYKNEELKGIVFMCVDSLKVRREFYKANEFNMKLKLVFDTRIALDDGQIYMAEWNKREQAKRLMKTAEYKDEEVEVPVSACGTKLAVLPTTQTAALLATTLLINYIKDNKNIVKLLIFNAFSFTTTIIK